MIISLLVYTALVILDVTLAFPPPLSDKNSVPRSRLSRNLPYEETKVCMKVPISVIPQLKLLQQEIQREQAHQFPTLEKYLNQPSAKTPSLDLFKRLFQDVLGKPIDQSHWQQYHQPQLYPLPDQLQQQAQQQQKALQQQPLYQHNYQNLFPNQHKPTMPTYQLLHQEYNPAQSPQHTQYITNQYLQRKVLPYRE